MNNTKTLLLALFLNCMMMYANSGVNTINRSAFYPIESNKPSPGFFEGAVLGNGGLGVIVTTRPDAVCLHFGHNNVWDIRLAEDNREKIGTFADVFKKARALSPDLKSIWDDKMFSDYLNMTADNYRKPYPRPFPCGTVVLGLDRRNVEVLGHKIYIDKGLCEVYLLNNGKKNTLQLFVESENDRLWFRLVDENSVVQPSCFNRLHILPDIQTPADIPPYSSIEKIKDGILGFSQVLPYSGPRKQDQKTGHPKDKAFRLEAQISPELEDGVRYTNQGLEEKMHPLEKNITKSNTPFFGVVSLTEGLAKEIDFNEKTIIPTSESYSLALTQTEKSWEMFWSKSGVDLKDKFLEKIWYWNLYFFNCAIREGVTCPGLFANWSLGNIGTAWHGDYHLNYNTQQPFWLTFSSNHLDKNLPYVDLVHHLMPVSQKWAKEYYGMRGAFFPHSAYPVDMTMHPYPVPDWGWEIFETPWMVQGLWWHYLYSKDDKFLKESAFAPIKEAVLFLVDYMKRPDAHGQQWNDKKYHIFPTVPPELYGLQPGFKYNHDTQLDITLVKFAFNAFLESIKVLGYEKIEAGNIKDVKTILENMPDYSTTPTTTLGDIYTAVPGEGDKIVYNVPASLTHVFPGEEFGMDSSPVIYNRLVNTYKAHQNEGGNDIVFLNLQAARLGVLDLDKFKRQVNYAMLPNGTVTDKELQTGGRYDDHSDFGYMGTMGIWFENFALPVVINECLIQSYSGIIHLFPNWNKQNDATFSTLRAVGAFLVSSRCSKGEVIYVEILSERGSVCKMKNPWNASRVQVIRNGKTAEVLNQGMLVFKTVPNEKIELRKL
ncbi:MAG: hypothetical protein Q8904_03005 [Bacteroidota bacterium]|nr:hypothetical protein [Bacteroidota bacterium]